MEWLNEFALNHAWVTIVIAVILAVHTGLKAYRDAVDTTPETDDNALEKAVTILGKIAKYLAGVRSK
jgi:hypothetical protein